MYKLTSTQKAALRRLTDRANYRIQSVEKAFAKEGFSSTPGRVTDFEIREKWETGTKPLSRSTQFESKRAYEQRVRYLQSVAGKRHNYVRGYGEKVVRGYARIEQAKTIQGVESALGYVPRGLKTKIRNMSAGELKDFWDRFEQNASRMGQQYSSQQAFVETLQEFYEEDMRQFDG